MSTQSEREVVARALMSAGKVLALHFKGVRDPEGWDEALKAHRQREIAVDVFTGQPGALESWIAKEGE